MNAPDRLRAVEAELNYMVPMAEKPFVYTYTPPAGTPGRNGRIEAHRVTIRDARPIVSGVSLDNEGFALVSGPAKTRNYYDKDEIERVCYPEAIDLVRKATGASRVVIFDHTIRVRPADKPSLTSRVEMKDGVRGPVGFAHNDYTPVSGPQRVRDLMGDEAEDLLKRRFVFVNIWRPIRGPVLDAPLALCDARSVADADMAATDLVYPDRTGEVFNALYNPAHQWFYFPAMEREEAVLIKCYDSLTDGTARWSLHTAFDDPTAPADAPPRESVELRSIAFFDD